MRRQLWQQRREAYIPDSLNALVPQFCEKIPTDVLADTAFQYRRTDNGSYSLPPP